jgi:hypothetical protein
MTIETELPAVKVKALNKQAAALIVMINERIGSMFDDEATFSANEATQIMSMLEVVALKDDPGNGGDVEAERVPIRNAALEEKLTRMIVGISYRTPLEVFDIMCDRIRSALRDEGDR